MKKFLLGVVAALVIVLVFRFCEDKKSDRETLTANTALIQKELKNVGKLIVTEGRYTQVLTYKNSKDVFFGLVPSHKKALIIVNAKADIAYDLSKIQTRIDEGTKTVTITHIPEPELSINPDVSYYDIRQQTFNQFGAADFQKIKKHIEKSLRKKIEASELRTNAENRLITELSKIYILTHSLGWTLQYNEKTVRQEEDLRELKL